MAKSEGVDMLFLGSRGHRKVWTCCFWAVAASAWSRACCWAASRTK
jgi:hypothetical protein